MQHGNRVSKLMSYSEAPPKGSKCSRVVVMKNCPSRTMGMEFKLGRQRGLSALWFRTKSFEIQTSGLFEIQGIYNSVSCRVDTLKLLGIQGLHD